MYTRSSLVLVALTMACAPTLSGEDQVPDDNVLNTGQGDALWDYAQNPNVDALMQPLLTNAPGCAVGIMVDGKIDYLHGYGWADHRKTQDTRIYTEMGDEGLGSPKKQDGEYHVGTMGPVGSVSKPITALAALQLVEDGIWSLNTTVGDVMPTAGGDLATLTVEELLSHQRSVGVDDAWIEADRQEFLESMTPAQAEIEAMKQGKRYAAVPNFGRHERLGDYPYDHPMSMPRFVFEELGNQPVSNDAHYSNVSYTVVGAMLDQQTVGKGLYGGYERWVWRHVGQPYNSLFDARNMRSWALIHAYRMGDIPEVSIGAKNMGTTLEGATEWERYDPWDNSLDSNACVHWATNEPASHEACLAAFDGWEGPSGGWTMTVGDLTRLAIAIDDLEVVHSGTITDMMDVRVEGLPSTGDYGLGVEVGMTGDGDAVMRHHGRIGNHTASFWYWPATWATPPSANADGFAEEEARGERITSMGVALQCNGLQGPSEWGPVARGIRDLYMQSGFLDESYVPGAPWAAGRPVIAMVDPKALANAWFTLELSTARISTPENLALPLVAEARRLVLTTESDAKGGLALQLGVGTERAGAMYLEGTPLDLGYDSFSDNPRFAGSSVGTLVVPTSQGDLVLEQPSIDVSSTADGGRLLGTLRGQLDTRSITLLGGTADRDAFCADWGPRGTCEPCDDGAPHCLSVTIEGVLGEPATAGR